MVVGTRIDTAAIRLQAARIMESAELRRAEKLRQLLQFFVEERIAFGDRPISQRRLAEEVFAKDAGFSPSSNAHVRIYLRRLRERLTRYYAGPGSSDPLVLAITAGTYRLSVEARPAASATAGHTRHQSHGAAKAARHGAKPVSLVLLTDLSAPPLDGDLSLLPVLVPRALVQHLLGQDGLVAIGPVPRERLSDPPHESPVAQASAATYLLDGTMTVRPHRADGRRPIEIVVHLHDLETNSHVWSRTCSDDLDPRDLVTAAERIAARLAAAILAPTP